MIDQEKLRTSEGRMEVFEAQGTAMALEVATTLANVDSVEIWTKDYPNPHSWLFYSQKVVIERSVADSAAIGVDAHAKAPPGKKELYFSVGGQNPYGEGRSDTGVRLTVPESMLEQARTPQGLLEALEDKRVAAEVVSIYSIAFDASEQEDLLTSIRRNENGLVMDTIIKRLEGWDFEPVEQAEPFGRTMTSAARTHAAILARV